MFSKNKGNHKKINHKRRGCLQMRQPLPDGKQIKGRLSADHHLFTDL